MEPDEPVTTHGMNVPYLLLPEEVPGFVEQEDRRRCPSGCGPSSPRAGRTASASVRPRSWTATRSRSNRAAAGYPSTCPPTGRLRQGFCGTCDVDRPTGDRLVLEEL